MHAAMNVSVCKLQCLSGLVDWLFSRFLLAAAHIYSITVIDTCSPSKNVHNGYAIHFSIFSSLCSHTFYVISSLFTFLFVYLHQMQWMLDSVQRWSSTTFDFGFFSFTKHMYRCMHPIEQQICLLAINSVNCSYFPSLSFSPSALVALTQTD